MNNEYITKKQATSNKQQAIDLAESLRNIAGDAITDAYIKGAERMLDCWISVKDRLPADPQKRVLVATANRKEPIGYPKIDTDRYDESKRKYGGWVRYCFSVTHWMPLPEPPKEE